MYRLEFFKNGHIKSVGVDTQEGHIALLEFISKHSTQISVSPNHNEIHLPLWKTVVSETEEEMPVIRNRIPNRQSVDFILDTGRSFDSFSCPTCSQSIFLIDVESDSLIVANHYPGKQSLYMIKKGKWNLESFEEFFTFIQTLIKEHPESSNVNTLYIKLENLRKNFQENSERLHQLYDDFMNSLNPNYYTKGVCISASSTLEAKCPICQSIHNYREWVRISIDESAAENLGDSCLICQSPAVFETTEEGSEYQCSNSHLPIEKRSGINE